MAWLHENQGEFKNAVLYTADQNRITPAVVEKDYYVTLILRGLKERFPFIVFKGGTSLSKCHKVISRFSEVISPEYWAGWALAEYQWYSKKRFKDIFEHVKLSEIISLYQIYHENKAFTLVAHLFQY